MGFDKSDFPKHVQDQIEEQEESKGNGTPIGEPARAVANDHNMNKTEQRYAAHLQSLKIAGDIKDWLHEPFNIRISFRNFYKPDFLVVTSKNEIEIHEVKGRWIGDAKVKIKTAAERVPWFRYKAVYYNSSGWNEEVFEPFRGTKELKPTD